MIKEWAGALLVDKKGRLVLQEREEKSGITLPGYVAMFGGTMEPGETPEKGAERELLEELNLSLSLRSRDKLGDFRKTKELDGEDYLIHVFLVQGIDREKLELREGKAIRFLERGESLEGIKLTRITRLAIENFYRSREIEKG